MKIIQCSRDRHQQQILDIFNDVIATSTALYDYQPRTLASMGPWFDTKEKNDFPVIGVEDDDGALIGFASFGSFRAWPAYKYTVEHSIYVKKETRAKGLGTLLLRNLIEEARKRDCHVMIGGIDVDNASSVRLHTRLGFSLAGVIHSAGFKFGRWLDLAFYELILDTPKNPCDG